MATPTFGYLNSPRGAVQAMNWDWDSSLLDWVPSTGAPVVGVTGPVSIANGADVAEGATTDAAVVTDTTGTVSGKLRGLVKWAFERMPASLGQKVMAASLPVVIASDQTVPVSGPLTNVELRASNVSVTTTPLKSGTVLTITPLGAGAAFTQAWQDSTTTGAVGIECTVRTDQASGTLGFVIQETDDTANADFITTLTAFSVAAGVTLTARTPIRARYYRVSYTNGATPQGAFELTQTTSSISDTTLAVYSILDPLNTSIIPLAGNATFTGTAVDLLLFKAVTVVVFSDVASAIDGLNLEWSQDGTNWDLINPNNVFADVAQTVQDTIRSRFFRVVYVNGSAAQATFRLQTLLHPAAPGAGVQQLSHHIRVTDSSLLTHAVISGRAVTQQDYVDAKVQPSGALLIASEGSVLGDVVTSIRRSQFDVVFATTDATDASIITNTTSGSGAVTQANGQGLYATGTGAAGQAKGVTVQSVLFRSATDIVSYFSVGFTTPTDAVVAHSHQRIGLFNTTDGLFVGMEGQGFGVTTRVGSVDTFVPQASFNLDLLDGNANSVFTRIGIPEALDVTKNNVYRIRFSWFGTANIFFDVFSPDGGWVPFHVIRYPNTATIPSIATPNLPMTVDAFKTASDATSLVIRTACWAAGLNESAIRMTDPIVDSTLAIPTRSVLVGHTTAGGGAYVNVKVNPSGALTTDVTATDLDIRNLTFAADKVDASGSIVKEIRAATSAVTAVADNAASVTLLAANANRLGASIENDSSAVLYVKFGTTASATDYTVRMVQYAYYEVPFGYTGRIDGIWATDPADGAARITELTA